LKVDGMLEFSTAESEETDKTESFIVSLVYFESVSSFNLLGDRQRTLTKRKGLMKKIIFICALIIFLLYPLSIKSQTVSKDSSQTEILKLQKQAESFKTELEKLTDEGYQKAIEGANQSIFVSTLVVLFVTLLAIAIGIFGYFRIRELKTDYKETKAELRKSFEYELEKVKEYKNEIKTICEDIKEKGKFVDEETDNFKKRMKAQQEMGPPDFTKEEVSQLTKKDSKIAIEEYEKVMNKIFDEGIYLTMAYNYYVEEKYDESIVELKKVLRLKPGSYDAYNKWGANLAALDRHEEAIEKYKKAIELKPDYAGAYSNWGAALTNLGRHEEAIEKSKRATELKPDYAEAYSNWGVALGKLGRNEEAIEKYKKATELKPDFADAYYNWGVTLGKLGRHEEAIEKYKKATELKPDFAEAYSNWGAALGNLGKREDEIEKCKRATELKPDLAEAYFNWGVALGKLGRYEQAVEKYKKATELKPDFAEAYSNWGVVLRNFGRYEEAIEQCKKATELKPSLAEAWYNTACVRSLQNNKPEVLKNLKKAIELDPSNKEKTKKDEDFKNLWEDEDFKKLVE